MSVYDKLGLFKNINPCDSDFVGKLNFNFKALDSISFGVVKEIVSELPPTPSDQDVYILTDLGQYSFYFFDNGAWQQLEVRTGVSVFLESENWYHWFDGIGFNAWPFDGAADVPIHSRPSSSEVNDSDLYLIEQGGEKKSISALNMKNYFGSSDEPSETKLSDLAQEVINFLVPSGTVILSILKSAPSGYIEADGKTIGPTGASADYEGDDYKNLYFKLWELDYLPLYSLNEAISITSGKGISASDDWNNGKLIRINLKLGNAFPRAGSNIGSYSGDMMRNISGTFKLSHIFPTVTASSGIFTKSAGSPSSFNRGNGTPAIPVTETTFSMSATGQVPTGDEFKPKSITYNVFVKY